MGCAEERFSAALLLAAMIAGFASSARAGANGASVASASGSLNGTTRNAAGDAVPRITVTVHRIEGEVDRTVISGAAGNFGFEDLKPGHYKLMASNEGPNSPATVVEGRGGQSSQVDLIAANGAPAAETAVATGTAPAASPASNVTDPAASTLLAQELAAMKARIEQLEDRIKDSFSSRTIRDRDNNSGQGQRIIHRHDRVNQQVAMVQPQGDSTGAPACGRSTPAVPAVDTQTPFAYADWTWLNGTPRNKDAVWDSKFFTPEIRFDTNYVLSFNHPKDDTLGGSTEIFRSNEIQVEQISFGGDFHWQNVRGRVLTLDGMFGVTTPRNDASAGRGQWDLRGAYRYFAEAYGGYHLNVNHGLNVDAGIFVSYIGLFSYYNFDNWAYQPSYVSSNTPWFFNGIRIQWFPTDKLKIEPWIINGWQSYGRYGSKPGLGGQIL